MSAAARDQARAAALRAAEARLNPPPSYDAAAVADPSAPASTSPAVAASSTSTPAPLFGAPRAQTAASYHPTEKDDRETRLKFSRLLDRGIVRDNGYKQSAEAVETLHKIATNILTSDDPKFRSLKASNSMLKNKVLSVKGGHEYLIALGFRTQTVDFTNHYVFAKTLRGVHEMQIGADVLQDRMQSLQERVSLTTLSATSHKSEEAARRERALREIEADRDVVRARAERERIGRIERERAEKERWEREAEEEEGREAEGVVERNEEERREMAEAVVRGVPRGSGGEAGEGGEDEEMGEGGEEEEEEEDEDDGLPSYGESRWGAGRRLGG
ncbi:hypothetical protein IAT38_005531 [Cryptococcus sp. DSM 104549]